MGHATDILNAAGIAIDTRGVERDRPNGERSMATAVKTFAAMTGRNLTETEGWLFMVCLKAARATGGAYREDDYTDMAAYAALAGESAGGEAPAIKAGCEHTATITSDDGMTTICASCSMPRPSLDEMASKRYREIRATLPTIPQPLPEFCKDFAKAYHNGQKACQHEFVNGATGFVCKACGFSKPDLPLAEREKIVEKAQAACKHKFVVSGSDVFCEYCGHEATDWEFTGSAATDIETMIGRDIGERIAEAAASRGRAAHATATDWQKGCEHEFVTTGAGDKFDGKSLFCKYCGFTADCTHRYVQLTTGGLICADCKAPWAK